MSAVDRLQELPDADQSDHPLDVVGQHVERHLAAHVLQPPCQEMGVAPPGFGPSRF